MATGKAVRKIKGLEDKHILDEHKQLRDVRSIWVQMLDPLKIRPVAFIFMAGYVAVPFVIPALVNIALFISVIHFLYFVFTWRYEHLDMRMPASSNKIDYSDPYPDRKKFRKAEGIVFLGNTLNTGRELWASLRDVLTHTLVFGTTGSGKTEILLSIAFNALTTGGGFYYIDPKASPKLPMQIYTMARLMGRDDAFRVLNYQSDSKSKQNLGSKDRTSNTNNPFKFGSAEALTQLLVSLIPKSEGDNAIFSQNAQTLITALMFGLVELRDKQGYELNINVIRKHMSVTEYVKLARRNDLTKPTRDALHSFLASVGWVSDKGTDEDPLSGQPRSFAEQFGYARSYFGLSLASLTDTYGNIYNTEFGEVDMQDVIMSRRICVVLLPTLAKSPQELENLGKISLSALKNACSAGLGDGKIEGTVEDILETLPVDSETVFYSITDEYESIPTPGYADIFTQARSLGVAGVCATQSYGGMKMSDEKGAQKIVENTKIKLISTVETGEGTYEFIEKMVGGEVKVLQSDGYHIPQANGRQEQNAYFSYRDQGHAKVANMKKVHLQDFQTQIEGEFHVFFRGRVSRGNSFYTNIVLNSNQQLRIAHMAKITLPDRKEFERVVGLAESFKKMIQRPPVIQCSFNDHTEISRYFGNPDDGKSIEERTIATLLNLEKQNIAVSAPITDNPNYFDLQEESAQSVNQQESELVELKNEIKNIDVSEESFNALVIDDTGGPVDPEIITSWLNEDYAEDMYEIEKKFGTPAEQAIKSTATLISETAANTIDHPPEPPLPSNNMHDEIVNNLQEILQRDTLA